MAQSLGDLSISGYLLECYKERGRHLVGMEFRTNKVYGALPGEGKVSIMEWSQKAVAVFQPRKDDSSKNGKNYLIL